MAAHIILKPATFGQFAQSMGWTTQAQAAAALGVSEITMWRTLHGRPVSSAFIAALLNTARRRKCRFADFFEVTATEAAA